MGKPPHLSIILILGVNQREKISTTEKSGYELQKVVPRKMTHDMKQVYQEAFQVNCLNFITVVWIKMFSQ